MYPPYMGGGPGTPAPGNGEKERVYPHRCQVIHSFMPFIHSFVNNLRTDVLDRPVYTGVLFWEKLQNRCRFLDSLELA